MGAFGTRIVMVAGADATQEALTTKAKSFSQDGWTYLIDGVSRGLMLMSFDEHRMHRRIMQEAFTRDRLASYVDQLGPTLETSIPQVDSGPVHAHLPLLKALTLDVATEVFMAGREGARTLTPSTTPSVATVRAASSIIRFRCRGLGGAPESMGARSWRTTSPGICRRLEVPRRRPLAGAVPCAHGRR